MVKRREKCLQKLVELRALHSALTPLALKAAKRSEVTLTNCPPLTGESVLYCADVEILAQFLSVTVEIARYERKLARLEVSA